MGFSANVDRTVPKIPGNNIIYYSTDYVNCPPLKEKKTLGEKKTQERRTSRKNRKENSIQKSKTKLQDEIFLLVILAFPSCNSSSLLLRLFSLYRFFAFKFRLAISSCYFVLQFRLRLRFSLVLVVAGICSRKIHASTSF